uniref:Uncharacterized protein n=1 Tax=Astyanax mexicanus TaxID=7994 RepID=A0A8B9KGW3_ASTMX
MGQAQSEDDDEVDLVQIQTLYTAFMKQCPSGALHLHEFRNIFGVQSSSEEEALFMDLYRSKVKRVLLSILFTEKCCSIYWEKSVKTTVNYSSVFIKI